MLCGNGFRIKLHERKSMDIEFFLKYFARALTLLLVLPLHEAAHAGVARLMGDDTAQRQGRLTINPFSHLDPLGSLLIMLTGFGWAKPVPVNPMRMKKYRAGFALTALAGPVSNLLAAIAAAFVHAIIYSTEAGYKAIFEYLVYDNITPLFCVILLTEFLILCHSSQNYIHNIFIIYDFKQVQSASSSGRIQRAPLLHQRKI